MLILVQKGGELQCDMKANKCSCDFITYRAGSEVDMARKWKKHVVIDEGDGV